MNIYLNHFFDNYYVLLYYFQYYFYKFILSYNISNILSLCIIFIFLGSVTIFTPCFLSVLPLSLSYVSSASNSFVDLILFIIGLLTSFLSFILPIRAISLYTVFDKLPIFSDVIMILVSLDLMNIINLSNIYLNINSLFNLASNRSLLLKSYFMGLAIGFTSLPCNTSILFIINFLVNHFNNTFSIFLYILSYFIGLVITLFLIFSFKLYSSGLNLFSTFWLFFNRCTGSLIFIFSLVSLLKLIFS